MVTVKTTGIEEVKKALSAFTVDMRERIIDTALDKAADFAAGLSKKEAPVSKEVHYQYYGGRKNEVRPGNLKRSIARIPRIKGSRDNKIRLVGPRSGSKYKNDGWYGHMVEQGTFHSKANPFQQRAASQAETGIENIIVDAVEKAIRKLNR
jgi:HK97 gp10 family phage protein